MSIDIRHLASLADQTRDAQYRTKPDRGESRAKVTRGALTPAQLELLTDFKIQFDTSMQKALLYAASQVPGSGGWAAGQVPASANEDPTKLHYERGVEEIRIAGTFHGLISGAKVDALGGMARFRQPYNAVLKAFVEAQNQKREKGFELRCEQKRDIVVVRLVANLAAGRA